MYRKEEQSQVSLENFKLPVLEKLSENNRWVIMASLIPWSDFEEEYASIFSEEIGAPAKSLVYFSYCDGASQKIEFQTLPKVGKPIFGRHNPCQRIFFRKDH